MDRNLALDYRSALGILLFLIGFIIGAYMFITPISHVFIHIDELWTAALIRTSFAQCINLTIMDVHPPLYYIIVKVIFEVLNALHIQYDPIYAMHAISVLPFFGILIACATKIRQDYGWLTAGIFAFAVASMSEFFIIFLTIRMYGWGIFFLVMAFIYFRDAISKSDRKSWILFALFTVLGCYTHYILLVGFAMMYLLALIYVLKNSEGIIDNFKKWLLSAVGVLLLYLPWILVLVTQVEHTTKYDYTVIPTNMELLHYFGWITTVTTDQYAFILQILTIIFVLFILAMFARQYKGTSGDENFWLASGFVMYAVTYILCVTVLVSAYKSLSTRYLLPVCAILWLCFSVIIGRIESKRIVIASVVLVLIFGIAGMACTSDAINQEYDIGQRELAHLEEMNSSDSVIVFSYDFMYICYHDYLTNASSMYSMENFTFDYKQDDVNISQEIYPILKENPGKDVYVIKLDKHKKQRFDHDIKGKTFFSRGNTRFVNVNETDI